MLPAVPKPMSSYELQAAVLSTLSFETHLRKGSKSASLQPLSFSGQRKLSFLGQRQAYLEDLELV